MSSGRWQTGSQVRIGTTFDTFWRSPGRERFRAAAKVSAVEHFQAGSEVVLSLGDPDPEGPDAVGHRRHRAASVPRHRRCPASAGRRRQPSGACPARRLRLGVRPARPVPRQRRRGDLLRQKQSSSCDTRSAGPKKILWGKGLVIDGPFLSAEPSGHAPAGPAFRTAVSPSPTRPSTVLAGLIAGDSLVGPNNLPKTY